jgi:hypothetical protein
MAYTPNPEVEWRKLRRDLKFEFQKDVIGEILF